MTFQLTHPKKMLFPSDKITKEDLLEYYLSVASLLLPLIKDHVITQHKFPSDIHHQGFIQKNIQAELPRKVKSTPVIKKENNQVIHMLLCNNKETLAYLVNQGCISLHSSLSKKEKPYCPDKLVFDLDPSTSDFEVVRKAAWTLKGVLNGELKLNTFLMTTGSKGLHIVIPIKPTMHFDQVREFAKKIAMLLCQREPKSYTIEVRKNKRGKKVFIDYLRNAYNQTSIAPYSVRALDGAPIAMPIRWEELCKLSCSQDFTLKNYKKKMKNNPWVSFNSKRQSLKWAMKELDKLLE